MFGYFAVEKIYEGETREVRVKIFFDILRNKFAGRYTCRTWIVHDLGLGGKNTSLVPWIFSVQILKLEKGGGKSRPHLQAVIQFETARAKIINKKSSTFE